MIHNLKAQIQLPIFAYTHDLQLISLNAITFICKILPLRGETSKMNKYSKHIT